MINKEKRKKNHLNNNLQCSNRHQLYQKELKALGLRLHFLDVQHNREVNLNHLHGNNSNNLLSMVHLIEQVQVHTMDSLINMVNSHNSQSNQVDNYNRINHRHRHNLVLEVFCQELKVLESELGLILNKLEIQLYKVQLM